MDFSTLAWIAAFPALLCWAWLGRSGAIASDLWFEEEVEDLETARVFSERPLWLKPVLNGRWAVEAGLLCLGTAALVLVWAGLLSPAHLLFLAAAMPAVAIDLRIRVLPDPCTVWLTWLLLFLGSLGYSGFPDPAQAILGAAAGYTVPTLIDLASRLCFGRPAMGAGDAKLMAAIGALVGFASLPFAFAAACVLGSLMALTRPIWRRGDMPFGPALVAGAVAAPYVPDLLPYLALPIGG